MTQPEGRPWAIVQKVHAENKMEAAAWLRDAMRDLGGDPGKMNYELYTGPGTEAFNTAAFAAPAPGTFGAFPAPRL